MQNFIGKNQSVEGFQSNQSENVENPIIVGKHNLKVEEVERVGRFNRKVSISQDKEILEGIQASCDFIKSALHQKTPIYGVTTGFGANADTLIPLEETNALQNNLIRTFKAGAGNFIPLEDIRAAMLIRIKSHLFGVSGIRLEIIERMIQFLNLKITPYVHEFGSIGASGDLCPLAYIAGSLIGSDANFQVDFNGKKMDARSALKILNLNPIELLPKKGLAMVNGTSVMTGIAANCIYDAKILLKLTLAAHALIIQGLNGSNQSFESFIHEKKPHKGQIWVAQQMRYLLQGSKLVREEKNGLKNSYYENGRLVQDRYSLRCLAQFLGPIFDGFEQIQNQIEVEINSVTDNPIFDVKNGVCYHGGNFFGQYIGIAMDQLRYYVALMAKHLDVQIGLLMTPQFNNGLSASLVGNFEKKINMGLKSLQINGNSIMPLLLFYGNSIVDKFPSHAEQFNQNINSQGFNSANLARKCIDIFYQYVSIALIFGVQSVDLRSKLIVGNYNALKCLSENTKKIYSAIKKVVGCEILKDRPYIWNDDEQELDLHIQHILEDIKNSGKIVEALDFEQLQNRTVSRKSQKLQ